jgi:hypothetical protein
MRDLPVPRTRTSRRTESHQTAERREAALRQSEDSPAHLFRWTARLALHSQRLMSMAETHSRGPEIGRPARGRRLLVRAVHHASRSDSPRPRSDRSGSSVQRDRHLPTGRSSLETQDIADRCRDPGSHRRSDLRRHCPRDPSLDCRLDHRRDCGGRHRDRHRLHLPLRIQAQGRIPARIVSRDVARPQPSSKGGRHADASRGACVRSHRSATQMMDGRPPVRFRWPPNPAMDAPSSSLLFDVHVAMSIRVLPGDPDAPPRRATTPARSSDASVPTARSDAPSAVGS